MYLLEKAFCSSLKMPIGKGTLLNGTFNNMLLTACNSWLLEVKYLNNG